METNNLFVLMCALYGNYPPGFCRTPEDLVKDLQQLVYSRTDDEIREAMALAVAHGLLKRGRRGDLDVWEIVPYYVDDNIPNGMKMLNTIDKTMGGSGLAGIND